MILWLFFCDDAGATRRCWNEEEQAKIETPSSSLWVRPVVYAGNTALGGLLTDHCWSHPVWDPLALSRGSYLTDAPPIMHTCVHSVVVDGRCGCGGGEELCVCAFISPPVCRGTSLPGRFIRMARVSAPLDPPRLSHLGYELTFALQRQPWLGILMGGGGDGGNGKPSSLDQLLCVFFFLKKNC